MATARKKVLSVVMAAVLAFSMVSVGALSAFAATASGKAVYDSVYGVFGGEYALMMKSVTYESVYRDMTINYTDTITDIVNTDGTVLLHTSTAPLDREQDMGTGGNTDFRYASLGNMRTDLEAGIVEVWSKTTGKAGVRTLDGRTIIPLAYDALYRQDNTVIGLQYAGAQVNVAFFDLEGAQLGSFSYDAQAFDPTSQQGHRMTNVTFAGDLVAFDTSIVLYGNAGMSGAQSKHYYAFAMRDGAAYKQDSDIVKAFNSHNGALVEKKDGFIYAYDAQGAHKIAASKNVQQGYVQNAFVCLEVSPSDGPRPQTLVYTMTGKRVGDDSMNVSAWLRTAIVMSPDMENYTVFDADGNVTTTIKTSGELHQISGCDFFTITEDNGESYAMTVYDAKGSKVKTLDVEITEAYAELYPSYSNGVVAGYYVDEWYTVDEANVYFDLNFNKVAQAPADSSSALELANGTKVIARVTTNYDPQTGAPSTVSSVTDVNGNPVTIGNYTLDISVASGNNSTWSSVKRGDQDIWFATDKSGKWGAIDSAGNVKIPFEYEGYYDGAATDTTFVLVKKDGEWLFYDTKDGSQVEVPEIPEIVIPETAQRLQGSNALGTMSEIVKSGNFSGGGTVVLAQFEGYWDALAGAGIAGLENAPVLMTFTSSLAPQTEAVLKELKPTKIIVCGGEGSLPKSTVDAAAKAAGTNPEIVRAAGNTAVDTAIDIYNKGTGWANTALIATVGTFQDALAAAPVAYAQRWPIFLASYDWAAEKGTLSDATIKAMKDGGIKTAYIAGGEYWISKEVESQLAAAGIACGGRLAGDNAMQTSESIGEFALSQGMSANALGLATVTSYYDALCGAALCGRMNSVMLLVNDAASPSIAGFVANHSAVIDGIFIFGGDGTIDPATYAAITKALGK